MEIARTGLAQRWAWSIKHGPIPDGMILCHRCDERRCVNPDHLFLGTRADNNADIKARRLQFADARAATTADSAQIRIFYRGLELTGDVRVFPILPLVGGAP
jgi:hypothetical protein